LAYTFIMWTVIKISRWLVILLIGCVLLLITYIDFMVAKLWVCRIVVRLVDSPFSKSGSWLIKLLVSHLVSGLLG
jgi:hypothetical protein